MDFSSDNIYLMYMDNIGKKCFLDLKNKLKTDTLDVRHEVEWISEGLKISEKRRVVSFHTGTRPQLYRREQCHMSRTGRQTLPHSC
jgi:hypothetical protein